MNWEEELKELLQPAQTKDGWGYAVIEADADGFYKVIIPFISALLKEQRENCQQNYKIESMDRNLPISARVSQAIANAPEPKGIK